MAYDWTTIDAGKTYISNFDILGTEKYLKDSGARTAINDLNDKFASYTEFLGVTTTELIDGVTTSAVVTINGEDVTAVKGNIVIYNKTVGSATKAQEFIYDGTVWQLFGDLSGLESQLGDLAYTNNASASYTPVGDVSVTLTISANQSISTSGTVSGSINATFSGAEATITTNGSVSGDINATFSGAEANINVSGTPSGTISTAVNATGNYQPTGTVAYSITTGETSVVQSATQGTLPTFKTSLLTASVSGETLTFTLVDNGFDAGSLPTFTTSSVINSVTSNAASFTGTSVQFTFTGTSGNYTGKLTPEGTITGTFSSDASFTGTYTPEGTVTGNFSKDATFTGTFTPVVTVSSATFTGTASTISVSAPRS